LYAATDIHHATWTVAPGTLNFGTGDFTIRLWFKNDEGYISGGYQGTYLGTVAGSSIAYGSDWFIGMRELDSLSFSYGGNVYIAHDVWGPASPGQWYHLVIERSSGIVRLYVNGNVVVSIPDTAAWGDDTLTDLHIGGLRDFDNTPGLHFDEIEIIKSAVYGGLDFIPPTAPTPSTTSLEGWHVVTDDTRFLIQYVDATTTRVTKLDSGSKHVKVVVRTFP
jgi:hypothetical protein